MEAYKSEFIEFMVESDVLKFGDFTLKSGRKSPFFMNAGAYVTGSQLKKLGEYYAKAIHENFLEIYCRSKWFECFHYRAKETSGYGNFEKE